MKPGTANYLAIGAMFLFLSLPLQDVLGYSTGCRRARRADRAVDPAALFTATAGD
jgi:hypothetical protein